MLLQKEGYTLMNDSCFLEFIPMEHTEEDQPQTKLAHEVSYHDTDEQLQTRLACEVSYHGSEEQLQTRLAHEGSYS